MTCAHLRSLAWISVFSSAALLGCSDDDGSGRADGGVTGDASVLQDGGQDAPTGDAGSAIPGPTDPTAFIFLNSAPVPAGSRASVTFRRAGVAYACTPMTFGSCVWNQCTRNPDDDLPAANVGPLTITGGLYPIAMTTDPFTGEYDPIGRPEPLWAGAGGTVLTVTGEGTTEVQGFTAQFTTTGASTLTAPTIPSGELAVPRSADIELRWTGGASDDVLYVELGEDASLNDIECNFPASAGVGVIPAGALARMGTGTGYMITSMTRISYARAGSWYVKMRTETPAVTPGGVPASTGVQFQ